MKTINLASLQRQVIARKAALGMGDTPASVEALRNKGATRTGAKRELLHRADKRAKAAGLKPTISHF